MSTMCGGFSGTGQQWSWFWHTANRRLARRTIVGNSISGSVSLAGLRVARWLGEQMAAAAASTRWTHFRIYVWKIWRCRCRKNKFVYHRSCAVIVKQTVQILRRHDSDTWMFVSSIKHMQIFIFLFHKSIHILICVVSLIYWIFPTIPLPIR